MSIPHHPLKQARAHQFQHNTGNLYTNEAANPATYTLSLHDALPIFRQSELIAMLGLTAFSKAPTKMRLIDRKSTRLNSSHRCISYAVFCLKKKKQMNMKYRIRC